MDRRRYLAVLGTALVGGCVGSTDPSSPTDSPTATDSQAAAAVGETVTYGGVEFAVSETRTASEFRAAYVPDETETGERYVPADGAQFAMAWVRAEVVGDGARVLPARNGDIKLLNDGESARDIISTRRLTDADDGRRYRNEWVREEAGDGVYPGTVVEGWAIFEVGATIDPNDATVAVEYVDDAAEDRTLEWQFDD